MMAGLGHEGSVESSAGGVAIAATRPVMSHSVVRPQRLHTWFNLIPVDEYERNRPREVLFLDTFVTIEKTTGENAAYRVLFEGEREMTVVVAIGIIFVWYGSDLGAPDRPFPKLFATPFTSAYVSSPATIFHDTHVMDFVENGSDNLHFKAVHLWDYSKIYDHMITADTITLKQDTRFRYGKCSKKRHIRLLSKVLPELELTQDYVYHGPGLAVVGAKGKGTPDMHSLVSLTPEGPNRTRVYVTIALSPATFPKWAERVFARFSPKRMLCDVLARVMAGYIQNEFDIDAVIWANRRYTRNPALLPAEKHLHDVIRWGETFYPPDFRCSDPLPRAPGTGSWQTLDSVRQLSPRRLRRYEIAEQQLVAYLDERGNPRVFHAYCPHQGAHFGHGGRIEDGCIRCPFHGFHFDPNGQCVGLDPKKRAKGIEALALDAIRHRVVDDRVEVLV
jgi:nitrite reductase/ring-hydroxylating ferredoxin subunit